METKIILEAVKEAAEKIAAPNWADKMALLVSFLAMLIAAGVAIYVARKQNKIVLKQAEIAEQQNKIALFEKRFEVYETLRKCLNVSLLISCSTKDCSLNSIYAAFHIEFGDWPYVSPQDDKSLWASGFYDVTNKLTQADFLFSEDVGKYIRNLVTAIHLLVSLIYVENSDKIFEDRKMEFLQTAKDIESNKILETMRLSLQLKPIDI